MPTTSTIQTLGVHQNMLCGAMLTLAVGSSGTLNMLPFLPVERKPACTQHMPETGLQKQDKHMPLGAIDWSSDQKQPGVETEAEWLLA